MENMFFLPIYTTFKNAVICVIEGSSLNINTQQIIQMGAHTYKPRGAEIELKVRKAELKSPFIYCTSEVMSWFIRLNL